jgi:hypothetical protein
MARRVSLPKGARKASTTPYEVGSIGPSQDPEAAAVRKKRMEDRRKSKLEALRASATSRGRNKTGIGALIGIGALAAGGGLMAEQIRARRREQAFDEFQRVQRKMALDQMAEQSARASLESSIERNLQNVERFAPDVYASIAAGRRLPQGAVVLGGEKRVDLLQELGRSMAEGQFSR